MRKGERTIRYIQERAAPLFNKRGFAGTSLADLTSATGLTKGALYGSFRDKEGIALAAFGYSMHHIREVITTLLAPFTSQKQKLGELFRFFSEYALHPPIPGGCPLMNYGVEADDSQRFMRRAVAGEMRSIIGFVQNCLDKGVKAGEFMAIDNTERLASMFFCSIEGAIVVSRVTGTSAHIDAVVAHCCDVLDQISVRRKTSPL